MANKHQFLHELLKQDQEPFQLKTYISEKRSKFNQQFQTTAIQINKPKPLIPKTSSKRNNLCKNACFFSFQSSPDVTRSPFVNFPSPAIKSPCKSPNGAVFHIPSKTAAILVEAAMRIQKQQQSKSKSQGKTAAFGLLGSFLKRLKDRSKSKKRAIGNSDIEEKLEESVRISCACNSRRMSSADWTESIEDNKSCDLESSTNSSDFGLMETRYCLSPFRFSLHKSASTSGSRTPEFCSPVTSPTRHVSQEKENFESGNLNNVQVEEEEEKEQCSPVSVLDPPFEEDDENESRDTQEDDYYDHECSYANVQRAKQQLLNRLRRFEQLAELDPMELERKLLEGSDDDEQEEMEGSDEDEPFSLYKKHSVDTFVHKAFNNSRKISADMKMLVSDLIIEEKTEEIICASNKEVVMGRVWNRLDTWKHVELDTIDMMIGLDLKRGLDRWKKFPDQMEEIADEIEIEVYGLMIEELYEEMCNKISESIECL